uniref:Uncharacterized protein n=1 Tax=Kalanchoe fedtschenkoi TaxID=63787 RepID=A0A7N0U4N4_KALFE
MAAALSSLCPLLTLRSSRNTRESEAANSTRKNGSLPNLKRSQKLNLEVSPHRAGKLYL